MRYNYIVFRTYIALQIRVTMSIIAIGCAYVLGYTTRFTIELFSDIQLSSDSLGSTLLKKRKLLVRVWR
ncbi:hypothetical protein GI364_19115 [Alicyclobacillus sp. SO9]|nr:hypothetical protein GI364_19115 [Alicyclobacillus sp. SO9]